jgi:hypothetical protein
MIEHNPDTSAAPVQAGQASDPGGHTVYFVLVPMPGTESMFHLCTCDTSDAVSEVVRILTRGKSGLIPYFRIEVHYV